MRSLVIVPLLALSVVSTRPAHACGDTAGTPPACELASFSLPYDAPLPANVPAIPFRASSGTVATMPTLRAADGSAWPTTIAEADGQRFLVPTKPLTENADWTIEWTDSCAKSGPARASFRTSTNVPIPKTLGTLGARLGKALAARDSCGGASLLVTEGAGSNGADLTAEWSADLRKFSSVTRLEATLDGKFISRHSIWTPCDLPFDSPAADRIDSTTTPGKHVVAMRAIVANQPPTSWVTTEVTLSCGPGEAPLTDSGADGSVVATDAGTSPAAETKGCAMGSSTRTNALVGLLAALVALAIRRR